MAFLLLLFAMMATTSNVFANVYSFGVRCDGISYGATKYCYVNKIGGLDLGYYTMELVTDYSGSRSRGGCGPGYYGFLRHNNRMAIRVSPSCDGYFGFKPKQPGFPYKGTCGQNNYGGFKIINGRHAVACQFPWMAFVGLDWKSGYRTSCGGSIVGDRWILTAAHCIIKQGGNGESPPPSAILVQTGSLDKYDNYIQRPVDWLVTHPSYNRRTLSNDIALLRLRDPIKWDGCHSPICLNKAVNTKSGLTCTVSGWGQTSLTGANIWPRELRWAYDVILSRSRCDAVYGSFSTGNTLCGRATSSGQRGFCAADSGGPLVCSERQGGKLYQWGLVSSYIGTPCTLEGLYTRVAAYYNWIKGYIR